MPHRPHNNRVRITLADCGLEGAFDAGAKTLAVAPPGALPPAAAAAAAAGRAPRRSFSRGGGRSGSGGGNGGGGFGGGAGGGGGNGGGADAEGEEWRADLARLRNPLSLKPLVLPKTLQLFSEVPVVLGMLVSKLSGHPTNVGARLFTAEVAAEAARAAAAAAGEGAEGAGAAAAAEEAGALSEGEEARGGLRLGVLVDATMFDD